MLRLMGDADRRACSSRAPKQRCISLSYSLPPLTTLSGSNGEPTTSDSTETPARTLLKYRFPKTYRHHSLSLQLTASRTTAEARALVRCAKAGVNTPAIVCVDEMLGALGLEVIEGKSVRELLGGGSEGEELGEEGEEHVNAGERHVEELPFKDGLGEGQALEIMALIGVQLARMHQAHIIHGDLTTSNMMVRKRGEEVEVLIDFGLSNNSSLAEDKAVDLYVLERAFQSTHPSSEHLFSTILHSYRDTLQEASALRIRCGGQAKGTARDRGVVLVRPTGTIFAEDSRR
ncbi:hypothetical protein L7F22_063416 [Adiantum nelumboides]|nr:hypothetical protein [Adiantum nelumboides]